MSNYEYLTHQTQEQLRAAGYSEEALFAINYAVREGLYEWLAEMGVKTLSYGHCWALFHKDQRFDQSLPSEYVPRGDPVGLAVAGFKLGLTWLLASEAKRLHRGSVWESSDWDLVNQARREILKITNRPDCVERWGPHIARAWRRERKNV